MKDNAAIRVPLRGHWRATLVSGHVVEGLMTKVSFLGQTWIVVLDGTDHRHVINPLHVVQIRQYDPEELKLAVGPPRASA